MAPDGSRPALDRAPCALAGGWRSKTWIQSTLCFDDSCKSSLSWCLPGPRPRCSDEWMGIDGTDRGIEPVCPFFNAKPPRPPRLPPVQPMATTGGSLPPLSEYKFGARPILAEEPFLVGADRSPLVVSHESFLYPASTAEDVVRLYSRGTEVRLQTCWSCSPVRARPAVSRRIAAVTRPQDRRICTCSHVVGRMRVISAPARSVIPVFRFGDLGDAANEGCEALASRNSAHWPITATNDYTMM